MTSNFDRWEKDPFFSAAEEVQESADRMESAYRRWIHAGKNDIEPDTVREELRRDLHTALGTAKWQLEEFERAVRSSYDNCLVDDAVTRHRQFVVAIENQTSNVESSLRDSVMDEGKTTLPWVRLDEGERDELALFLVGTTADLDDMSPSTSGKDGGDGNLMEMHGGKVPESMKNSRNLVEFGPLEMAEERLHGHRRIASAADIGTWKIAVADDEDLRRPPPRILSFSSLLRTMELKSKPKWPKNWPIKGFRKWKGGDRYQVADTEPLQSHQLSRGIDACYERSKNCLDSCDESYNKQLDGWLGAVQRQLQRSQYKIKYCRPVQITFWAVLVLCLIVFITAVQPYGFPVDALAIGLWTMFCLCCGQSEAGRSYQTFIIWSMVLDGRKIANSVCLLRWLISSLDSSVGSRRKRIPWLVQTGKGVATCSK